MAREWALSLEESCNLEQLVTNTNEILKVLKRIEKDMKKELRRI